MKVFVTQGHEQGIGLEVFFKSCLLMGRKQQEQLVLLAFEDAVSKTLTALKLPFKLTSTSVEVAGTIIQAEWLSQVEHSQSLTALKRGMERAENGGVLFTLPTSKDQFQGHAGHTEFFRVHYNRPELGMFFSSPAMMVLLLSDHVPVSALSIQLTTELIAHRLKAAVSSLKLWKWPIERILVAGFNPHAGEGGIIGHEDERVAEAIRGLRSSIEIEMSGPLPGDTMLLEQRSPKDLLVYVFHDQGLGVFKGLQGFIGSNITLGLPYPRVSPDHGTSFKLYGKNLADYRGCAHSLKEALVLLERIQHGKNSSHKGKGSQP